MADASSLATIASIISAFGITMLFFRIQRELSMAAANERTWIPWSDRLLIAATLVSLFLVIVPMLILNTNNSRWSLLPPAAAATACTLVAGYIPAILAHYRIIFSRRKPGPRPLVELPEAALVVIAAVAAVAVGVLTYLARSYSR